MAALSMTPTSLPAPAWRTERRNDRVTVQTNGVTYGLDWGEGVEVLAPRWIDGFVLAVERVAEVEYARQSTGLASVPVNDIVRSAQEVARLIGPINAPAPDVLIGPDGTIQFDWTEGGFEIEINFSPGAAQGSVYVNELSDSSSEWEGSISDGEHILRAALTSLAA